MKKLMYVAAMLTVVGSLSFTGYEKTQAAGSQASLVSVRLCSSAPVGIGADAHLVQGLWHGVSVATASWRKQYKKAGLRLLAPLLLDDAKSDGSAVDPAKENSNAHTCLSSPVNMAYIGTLNSSMAQVSEPILNKGGMLMISPSNTNPILTSPLARSTYEPLTANHKLKYVSYYRVVTTDALQGPVGAIYMNNPLGVKSYFLVDDQETYGVGLAQHMDRYATGKLGMSDVGSGHIDTSSTAAIASSSASIARQVVQKNPNAIYCGGNEENCAPMLKAARRAGYKGIFFGGDAINDVTFGTQAGGDANAANSYSTTVGNPAAAPKSFTKLEQKYYKGWVPGPYDALAFDAANVALRALYNSKLAGTFKGSNFQKRSSLLKWVAKGVFTGTVGKFHFDKNGDTSVRTLSVWAWKGSAWSLSKVFYNKNLPAGIQPTP